MGAADVLANPNAVLCFFSGKGKDKTAYMHKPPNILPNLGKPMKNPLPKTCIPRVLLYENSLQQNILDTELKDINAKIRQKQGELYKKKFLFVDGQKQRISEHEHWETRYQRLKKAFISRYGTTHIPVSSPEPETNSYFTQARLVPILNILSFYLDAACHENCKIKCKQSDQRMSSLSNNHQEGKRSNRNEHEKVVSSHDLELFSKSIDDPRFRCLQCSLIPSERNNDGYLQLSPGYHEPNATRARRRKWLTVKHRTLSLPKFYSRQQEPEIVPRSRSNSSQDDDRAEKKTTFPLLKS